MPPIVAKSFREDHPLASFAKSITDAVISDKNQQQTKKEFETPFSVKKGERPLTFTEFKVMNKQVLFNMEDGDQIYHWEQPDITPHPSDSTNLSHKLPVKTVDSGAQELYAHPSTSTDLSLYSNWVVPPMAKVPASGQRQLKGRIVLVRIKKKISKVAKKMLFYPWKKKGGNEDVDGCNLVISQPAPIYGIPGSPSAESIMSITSSIMTGSGAKHIIGAIAPRMESPSAAQQLMYGAVNYGNRGSPESSSSEYDCLPAPPERMLFSQGEEDAVSYLAEAMRRAHDNDEDSVLLLVMQALVSQRALSKEYP